MEFGLDTAERAWVGEVQELVDAQGADEMLGMRREMSTLEVERHAPSFYAELCRRRWVGLGWPEPYGRDASETERFLLHEQLDCAGLPIYGLEISEAIGGMLVRHGPAELAAVHLPRIVDGTWQYAGGYSEPEAGSDLLALTTMAVREGDHYRVRGSKLWTSGAHLADWIFAIVRTDPDAARHRGLSLLLIDTSSPGVEIRPVPVMGGWRVNACFFDDVSVPVTNVVGREHEGWTVLAEALDVERSMSFGGREARLWLTRLLHRFEGRADELGEARLVELGRLVARLEVERLLNVRVAALGERGGIPTAEASMSKVYSSELGQAVAAWASEVLAPASQFGDGAGDPLAADVEQAVRAATVLTVIGGTSEVQRTTIAQRGLGLPR